MESILARALEYTLKYWLKSFSRDQFKLQGRTVQLSNLDIDGDALHSSLGLPPALNVTTAKVGKLEIVLPYVSNVQIEPIVVQIDKIDVVLEENDDLDASRSTGSATSSSSSGKSSGYGFADKIADGMTLEVHTVNLLLETHGGARRRVGATWASPMASITIRNLLLYTTNENWQVVNLKEAREFSSNKEFIYVFKKLEWQYLSIDLLPHPDMFTDAHFESSEGASNRKDDDGAKRVFFGGERFIEGISGEAYITIQRTELNSPLGLELQLHITEAVCPALSEPGLRALLRFFTGFYICLNRGDVTLSDLQLSTEAAGRTLVSVMVDHIFLCIKDAEFQLELLMQSLLFSRASVSVGENAKNLTRVNIGGLFLRDTFSRPPCTLIQPSMQHAVEGLPRIPNFGTNFCPPIYPLEEQPWKIHECVPVISLYSLLLMPSPAPPTFASQTVIDCQPLMIHLQEESCLRMSSFLADGIVRNSAAVARDSSINSLLLNAKGLDVTVPLDTRNPNCISGSVNPPHQSSFVGARLHIEKLFLSESPFLKLKLLNLEKDPACFCLWQNQPVDASQKKWTMEASLLSLSLETCTGSKGAQSSLVCCSELWKCVELKDACIQVAIATADGSPLIDVPPPGGVVRVGIACEQYLSNTSVEQLFFVLDLYTYFGKVSEKVAVVGKDTLTMETAKESLDGSLIAKAPGDTAVSLTVKDLQLRFLDSSSGDSEGMPLVQFVGEDLFIKVTHRTLGGAMAITSSLRWDRVEVDCADPEKHMANEDGMVPIYENGIRTGNGYPQLRSVFWVQNGKNSQLNGNGVFPFLNLTMVHVIPYSMLDIECHSLRASACIAGVRLGGGMNYAEALLHRFGILGPDGGPGDELSKGLAHLSSGPLSKLFKASPLTVNEQVASKNGSPGCENHSSFLQLGTPDDVDVTVELKDWLFALEGADTIQERWWFSNSDDAGREEWCWHTAFQSLQVKASGSPKYTGHGNGNGKRKSYGKQKHPIELVTVGVEGLKILKPQRQKGNLQNGVPTTVQTKTVETNGGINLEVDVVIAEEDARDGIVQWVVENLRFSVKQPIEAVVTKDELQYLALLCKSELDSMGRITAGVLRVLKLESSIGQAAIDQLSNLGSEGLNKIITPEKLSRGSSTGSIGLTPSSNNTAEAQNHCLGSTMASLETEVLNSQAKCAALTAELSSLELSKQLDSIKCLSQKLENIQNLLNELRTHM